MLISYCDETVHKSSCIPHGVDFRKTESRADKSLSFFILTISQIDSQQFLKDLNFMTLQSESSKSETQRGSVDVYPEILRAGETMKEEHYK